MTIFKLQFGKTKDCYLHCSSTTLKYFANRSLIQSVVVVLNQAGNNNSFFLAVQIDDTLCENSLYINRYFAETLSLSESTVTIHEAEEIAAISSLSLCCHSDDYSIVQLQYEYIETELMNQIKVVAEGMPIMLWLNSSLSIQFVVSEVKPSHATLLNTYSKVNVIEKDIMKDLNSSSQNKASENCSYEMSVLLPKLLFRDNSTKNLCLPEVSLKCFCPTNKVSQKLSLLSKISITKTAPSMILCYLSHCSTCCLAQSNNLMLMADKTLSPYFMNNESVILHHISLADVQFSDVGFEFQLKKHIIKIPILNIPHSNFSVILWCDDQAWKFDVSCQSNQIKVIKKKELTSSLIKTLTHSSYSPHDSIYETIINKILHLFSFPRKSFSLLTSNVECFGAGKTFLLHKLANDVRLTQFYITYKDAASLRGKRVGNILKEITDILTNCCLSQPAIFILDNLDAVLPCKSNKEDPSGDELFGTCLAYKLKSLFRKYKNSNVEIVISTKTASTCHPTLVDNLDNVYLIPLLSSNEQITFIKSLLPSQKTQDLLSKWLIDLSVRSNLTAGEVVKLSFVLESKMTEKSDSTPIDLHQICKLFNLQKKVVNTDKLTVSDCGGLSDVKKEIDKMLIIPFKYPDLISQIPFQLNRGLLLYGPPGVGKTHIVKAISNYLDMSFLAVKGPELLNKYIGASEEAIRNLFQKAEEISPTLIFFDEFDSLAPCRGNDTTGVMDRVVNQLLTELDGVSKRDGIFILAASSRPDSIDPAVLRPGRIGRYVLCPMPGLNERKEIWDCILKNIKHEASVNTAVLATKTELYSGADIKAIVYNAQLDLVKDTLLQSTDEILTQEYFLKAISCTKPSLSQNDLKNYKQKYHDFVTKKVSVGWKTTQK